ncbi:MAG: multicopper oxidase domain-containing protein [Acidobacteria bacterium]|nr:multicopper oxidase domain-containing protein [Acidobacteriota bacterium]
MKRLLLIPALFGLLACGGGDTSPRQGFDRPMPVPPILAPTVGIGGADRYDLVAQAGTTELVAGKPTLTYGYNGSILGPTLRMRRGRAVELAITNQLPDSDHAHTNLHPHGLKVPGDADIFPGLEGMGLMPGESASVRFTPDQPAGTFWYHPHPHGATGRQVNYGLAGYILMDDAVSDALPVPKTYGVDDFPVVFMDRHLRADGSLAYMEVMGDRDFMLGNHVLVNGLHLPYLELPAGTVRLRLLNGSSTRRLLLAFEDGRAFHQIASDGGFLEAPVAHTGLLLGPAERAEILVDLSGDRGQSLLLHSLPFAAPEEEAEAGMGRADIPLLQLRVTRAGTALPLPASLASVARIPESEATTQRFLGIEDTGDGVINGQLFDIDRVDFTMAEGVTEIWTVKNFADVIAHPLHIHGGQFQILDREGAAPAPHERGWKDTVLVNPLETVRVIMRFKDLSGRYVFHCHILEHEGIGMMGQFEVQ